MPETTGGSIAAASPGRPRRHRVRRRVRLILWLVAAILMANALVGDRGLLALKRARTDRASLAMSVVDLRQRNTELRRRARRLRGDPVEIEAVARGELGLTRPGEVLFIIRDVDQVAQDSSLASVP